MRIVMLAGIGESSWMIANARLRVFGLTCGSSLMMRETVDRETLASFAISSRVATSDLFVGVDMNTAVWERSRRRGKS